MMILSQYHIFELDTINIYSVGMGPYYSPPRREAIGIRQERGTRDKPSQ